MLTVLLILDLLLQGTILVLLLRRRLPRRVAIAGSLLCFAAMLLWAIGMEDSAWLYQHLPLKHGLVLWNLAPPLLAATLGFAGSLAPLHRWRIAGYAGLLLALNAYYYGVLLTGGPACGEQRDGIATLQTTEHTCAPAAAATLLRLHGIETDEAAMARLCLTSTRGTAIGQLYHGLRTMCDGRGLAVRVRSVPRAALAGVMPPAIISVRLTPAVDAREPRYRRQWGWLLGIPHAVVLLERRPDGTVRMADPMIGIETWHAGALEDLWDGKAVTLERER